MPNDQDDLERLPIDHGFGFSWIGPKWLVLTALVLTDMILTVLDSDLPTGETIGAATGFLFSSVIIAGIVWLVRGRKSGVFSSVFFWAAFVMYLPRFFKNISKLL